MANKPGEPAGTPAAGPPRPRRRPGRGRPRRRRRPGPRRGRAGRPSPIMTTLANGAQWDLANPSAMHVSYIAIAAGMAKLCRYAGATDTHYSEAQHACLLAALLPEEWRLYGLLRNAHRAMTGSFTAPARRAIAHRAGPLWRVMVGMEMDHMEVIHMAAGLPWPCPPAAERAMAEAEARIAATEWRDVIKAGPCPAARPLVYRITPRPWPAAEEGYTRYLDRYLPAHKRTGRFDDQPPLPEPTPARQGKPAAK